MEDLSILHKQYGLIADGIFQPGELFGGKGCGDLQKIQSEQCQQTDEYRLLGIDNCAGDKRADCYRDRKIEIGHLGKAAQSENAGVEDNEKKYDCGIGQYCEDWAHI